MSALQKHLVAFFQLALFVAMSVTITASNEEKIKYQSSGVIR